MSVQLKLVNCFEGNCSKQSYNKLFDQIEAKLYKYSKLEFNNVRFFLNKKQDCENCHAFEDLVYYKEILKRKIACDICLSEYPIEKIVSKIKKLLR